MIRHLIKIVWNRKRTNLLVMLEIFLSFLVLFAAIVLVVYYTDNYRHPLGFGYENVWTIDIEAPEGAGEGANSEKFASLREVLRALKEFDEIEASGAAFSAPYSNGTWGSAVELQGRRVYFEVNPVTDGFAETMGLTVTRGRWFGREDDGASWRPVVINERMAREVFGDANPLGNNIEPDQQRQEKRVIGVITDFRKDGEYAEPVNYVFQRNNVEQGESTDASSPSRTQLNFPRSIVIRVRPGTTAAFEEKLIARLQAQARHWTFKIVPVSEQRDFVNRLRLAPVIAVGLVAGFLMIMVALGLTGVVWQNVTQRTREIGLRRAKGATAGRIHMQILGELFVIASFGLLIGVLVVVQFPLLDLLGFVSGRVYVYSILIALALVYALTLMCGLYPSRLATRVHPAEALHYE